VLGPECAQLVSDEPLEMLRSASLAARLSRLALLDPRRPCGGGSRAGILAREWETTPRPEEGGVSSSTLDVRKSVARLRCDSMCWQGSEGVSSSDLGAVKRLFSLTLIERDACLAFNLSVLGSSGSWWVAGMVLDCSDSGAGLLLRRDLRSLRSVWRVSEANSAEDM
jgi:hypothetical protein